MLQRHPATMLQVSGAIPRLSHAALSGSSIPLAYASTGTSTAAARAPDSHKYGYDEETLTRALHSAGFDAVRPCDFMQGDDPALLLDQHSFAAQAQHDDGHYSLFVEARKAPL